MYSINLLNTLDIEADFQNKLHIDINRMVDTSHTEVDDYLYMQNVIICFFSNVKILFQSHQIPLYCKLHANYGSQRY